jgi:hypothetical protein
VTYPSSGTNPAWTLVSSGTSPYCIPIQGTQMAMFNSWNCYSGSEARISTGCIDFSGKSLAILKFYMYHNTSYTTAEYIQIQVSTDSVSWTNVSDPIYRYDASYGDSWIDHEVDLSDFAGKSNVYVAFLGHSEYYGNMYIDSIRIKELIIAPAAPSVLNIDFDSIRGESAKLISDVNPNFIATNVVFQYGLTTSYTNTIAATPSSITGYKNKNTSAIVSGLLPDTTYHFRVRATNSRGTTYSKDTFFRTLTYSAPEITDYSVTGNDGISVRIDGDVDGNNGYTSVTCEYGTTQSFGTILNANPHYITDSMFLPISIYNFLPETKYYYRVKATNTAGTVYSKLDSFTTYRGLYDTIYENNVFFKGRYVHLGISPNGAMGSTVNAPIDMHSRDDQGSYTIGFTADPGMDSWFEGTPEFAGDYFLPGSPEEGWAITVNGSNYNNNRDNVNDITGNFVSVKDTLGSFIANWEGAISGVDITHKITMPKDSLFFTFEAIIKNTTDSTLHNIYYMRNVDPDNERTLTSDYSTINTIVYQTPNPYNLALVSAVGKTYNTYLGLGTKDARAKVTYGGFDNRNPVDIWNNVGVSDNGSNDGDEAITLVFKIDSLPSGSCTNLFYSYILNEEQLMSALNTSLIDLSVNENNKIKDTTEVCLGSDVPLTIINGDDYTWNWTPSAGLNSSTGSSVIAQNVTAQRIYDVTGTYLCFEKKFKITLKPIEIPNAQVTNTSQTINSGETFVNMVCNTTNGFDGAIFNWTRTNEAGLATSLPLSGTGLEVGDAINSSIITNTTSNPIDIVFAIIPFDPNTSCSGDGVEAIITVNPESNNIENIAEGDVFIYPNPSNGTFTLNVNSKNNEKLSLNIVNVMGQFVYLDNNIQSTKNYNLSQLKSGIYYVNVKNNNLSKQFKLLIQK